MLSPSVRGEVDDQDVVRLAVVVVVDGRDDVSLITRFRRRVLEVTQ